MNISNDIVSIIVPIYNVEDYLQDCIESLIHQTYKKIEIILVDDGATDKSGDIADSYSNRFVNIKVYHKENGGLSDARNYGIERARGRYITFVDSDDFVSPFYIEILLKNLVETDSDISGCLYKRTSKRIIDEEILGKERYCWNSKIALKKMLCQENGFTTSACALLYKIECFDNVEFPKGAYFEDLGTTYKVLANINKMVRTEECLYYYYMRDGSISNNIFQIKYMDQLEFAIQIVDYVNKDFPELSIFALSRMVGVCFNIYMTFTNDQLQIYKTEANKLKNTIYKYRKQIIHNKEVPLKVRCACVLSYFGMSICRKVYCLFGVKGK